MPAPDRLLHSSFACECGQTHTVPVKEVVYSDDAYHRLADAVMRESAGREIVLLADKRTYALAGTAVEQCLADAGFDVRVVVVPDGRHGSPVCDDRTYALLNNDIPAVDFFVAVGSGVINDLTKWLAFERDKGYVIAATAASMNGYTAANVAPTLAGVKALVRARAPLGVYAVPSVIESAPYELTASGFGDLQAKCISVTDWKMNSIVFGDHFCPFCAEIISSIEPLYADHPEGVRNRNPESIKAVFDALIYSGLAMTLIGTSSPASGGEHLFSHTLDMMSAVDGQPHDLHGRQVGLGTLVAGELYKRVLSLANPVVHGIPLESSASFWGPVAAAVEEQYSAKCEKYQRLAEIVEQEKQWQDLIAQLRPYTVSPAVIADRLERAGAARYLPDIGCSHARAKQALLHMHEIRTRFTIVDLAWLTGVMPGAADEILEQWLENG